MEGIATRVLGEPAVIEEISELVRESDEAELVRVEQIDSGGIGADFDLNTTASLVTIASFLFFEGGIVPKLWSILRRHPGTKVTIETPTRTVSIESTEALTPEALGTILGALAKA